MLIKTLKLFGLDVPSKIAAVQAKLDERVEFAKDQVKEAAQTTAILAILFALAALAILSALGLGLIALYWWVAMTYGQFYGLAVVIGALIVVAAALSVGAIVFMKARSSDVATRVAKRRLKLALQEAETESVAPTAVAIADNSALRSDSLTTLPPAPASASDLTEPLWLILRKLIGLPTAGNVVLDELLVELRGAARGTADEAIEGVANTIRYGDRSKVFAILGASVLVGWWLGRHSPKNLS
jgi:ABC-type multidrug transport system fused ATPase/permease subunit